jgi:hypothetical protein
LKDKSTKVSSGGVRSDSLTKLRPIVMAIAFLMFFVSACGILLVLPQARSGHVDFRSFYTAGYMVRTGHSTEIYDRAATQRFQNMLVSPADGDLPFYHLAYESLIDLPFSYLGYQNAYYAFFVANLVFLTGSICMLWPYLSPLRAVWTYLPLAVVICFLPVAMALIEGQDSLLLLVLLVAANFALNRQRELTAGMLVGIALFKFQYALPIALLFFIWKRWRFLAGFALSCTVVSGLSFWLLGYSGVLSYLHYLPGASLKFSAANDTLLGIHPEGMANLRGLFYAFSGGSVSITNIATIVSSCLVLVWAAARRRPSLPGALLAALLVSFHQMISDASLLILPLGFVLAESMAPGRTRREQIALALASAAIIGPTFLLFAGTRFYLLALPVLGVFAFWDWPSASPNNGAVSPKRPQTDTGFTLSHPAGS